MTELVKLEFKGGSVFAVCICGKSFFAAGSQGICDFMQREIHKHEKVCETPPPKFGA